MQPPRLEHNRFVVSDLQGIIEFYQHLFGFEISWEGKQPTGERWVHLRSGDMYLSFSQSTTNQPIRKAPENYAAMFGYQHMGWAVADMNEYKEVLNRHGINFNEIETEVGQHVYFFDPENNEIELIEYK